MLVVGNKNEHAPSVAKKRSILQQMKDNPRKDWSIKDVSKLCDQIGLQLLPPKKGSHYKVCSQYLRDILTVPAHRPIKPIYIRTLVSFAEAHLNRDEASDE